MKIKRNSEERLTEEDLRESLEELRCDMENFVGHRYNTFEDGYKDLFGDGLEPTVIRAKITLTIDGETIEVDPDDSMANLYLRTILQGGKNDVNVKIGKLSFTIPGQRQPKEPDEPGPKKSESDDDGFEEVDLDDYDDSGNAKAKILAVIPAGKTKPVKVKVYEVTETNEANGKKKTGKFFICLGKPDGTVLYRNEERAEETGDAVWLKIKTAKGPFKPGKTREIIHTATTEKYADYEW